MKKLLWLVLVLILTCILTLSACDNGTDQPQNPDTEQSTNQTSDNNDETNNTDNTQTPSTDNTECQHTFGDWKTTKQATCNEEGELVRTCSKCSHSEKTTIAKNNVHTEVIDPAVAATCTTYGKTEGAHCSVCGETIVEQQKTSMKAHNESDWIVDKEATVEEEGARHKICSSCNSTVKTETIPKITPSQGLEFTFVSNDVGGYYYVSGIGTCTDTDIVIPDSYNGIRVSQIGNFAFSDCISIRSVTIPGSIWHIGKQAFSNCSSLQRVIISRGVLNSMGKYVFYNCMSLTQIEYKDWTGCWYAIDKGDGCFDLTGNYKIYCTDAIIDKTGRVTYY